MGLGLWLGTVRGAQGPQRLGGGEVVCTKLDFVKPLKSADSLRTYIPVFPYNIMPEIISQFSYTTHMREAAVGAGAT